MPLSFFTGIVSLLLALVTIPGNLIVCIAVLKDPFRSLKTPFTFFVVNLAVADLVVGAVIEPLSALTHFREGFSLEIRLFVVPMHMSYFISCTASVLNLAALTAVAFAAISYSCDCHSGVNLVGFSLAAVHLLQGRCFKVRLCVCQHGCGSYFGHFSLHLRSNFTSNARAQVSQWDTMRQSSQSEDNRARIRAASVEKNIIQAFMVMLGFFLCCYIPSCIIIYIMNLCSSCNCTTIRFFRDLQFIFVLSSSALNPFVEPVRPSLLKVVKRKINYDKIVKSSCLLSRSFGSIHPFLMGKYSFFCSLYFL